MTWMEIRLTAFKQWMEIRPSAWNSNRLRKAAIFELRELGDFAQESILVALKACGFDGP